jgi:membrane associated rhomboid family serine protease
MCEWIREPFDSRRPDVVTSFLLIQQHQTSPPTLSSRILHHGDDMLLPIGDERIKGAPLAWVTYLLILANLVVFVALQGAGTNEEFTYGYSVIPQEIVTGEDLTEPQQVEFRGESVEIPQYPGPSPIYLTLLTAMFMHGGILHLLGNLLYLWIFGDNVEHRFGALPFLVFYLVSGLAATGAQVALDPTSVIPTLGASGAISGILGAYLVLFPKNRVYAILFYFVVSIPAAIAIGLWIVFQLFAGWGSMTAGEEALGGVAYGAHIGGFFTGVILAAFMRLRIREEKSNIYTRFGRGG